MIKKKKKSRSNFLAWSVYEIVQQKHESLHELNWKAVGHCVINRSQEGDWGIAFSITPIQSRKLNHNFFFSSPCVLLLSFSEWHSVYSDIDSFFISLAIICKLNHETKFTMFRSFKRKYNCQEFLGVQRFCFYRLLQRW